MIPRSTLALRLRHVAMAQPAPPGWPTAWSSPVSLRLRAYTRTPVCQAAALGNKATMIHSPLPSLSSSIARLLPRTIPDDQLPFPRQMSESIITAVLEQVRSAAEAKTIYEAKAGWDKVDEQIRIDISSKQYPASSLTELTNVLLASSGDPRRHPIAFNMYRIAFGSDPSTLPAQELNLSNISHQSKSASSASESLTASNWGDWQSSYHWANLVLQGRAPPPPGTYLHSPGEQRAAQASQSSAAYRVFAHLASRGHPRGIFGIGRHLLSTLERGSDPTALGAMPASASPAPLRTRQETLEIVERMFRLAGEAGVEEAWFELAALYLEGKWVRKDDEKARGLLREGVERGSPRACRALAHLMTKEVQAPPAPSSLSLEGDDVVGMEASRREKLLVESLSLLERGAELGSADCAFSAGMRYLLQIPATGASEAATASLDMSLSPGSTRADSAPLDPIARARKEHLEKWCIEPSDESAAKCFALAVEGGNALAMMNLARMYLEDRVVPAMTGDSGSTPSSSSSSTSSTSRRQVQLSHASDLYAKILAKALGPEGQKLKAQVGMSGPKTSGVAGQRLDELGARAEEGLRLIGEEMKSLGGQ